MIRLKTKEEIGKIKAAGTLVQAVFQAMEKAMHPGISTYELDQVAQRVIRDAGGVAPCIDFGEPPYPAATCISIDEEIVHGIPRRDIYLKEGQIVSFDVVAGLHGWMADACRTYPVGEISQTKMDLIAAAEACFWAGFAQAKVGNRVGDISAAVQAYAEDHGYSVIRELTGHGIGTEMHEAPDVPNYGRAGRGPRLQEGMVLCIEPMIACGKRYVTLADDEWTVIMQDQQPSAHYENTIVITADGPEVLTLN